MNRFCIAIGLDPRIDKMIREKADVLYRDIQCHTFITSAEALAFLATQPTYEGCECIIFMPCVMDDEDTAANFDDAVYGIGMNVCSTVAIHVLASEIDSACKMETHNLGIHVETFTTGNVTKEVIAELFSTHIKNMARVES